MAFLKKYGLIGSVIIAAIAVVYYVAQNSAVNSAISAANQQNADAQATLQADQEQVALGSLVGSGPASISQPSASPVAQQNVAPVPAATAPAPYTPTILTATNLSIQTPLNDLVSTESAFTNLSPVDATAQGPSTNLANLQAGTVLKSTALQSSQAHIGSGS